MVFSKSNTNPDVSCMKSSFAAYFSHIAFGNGASKNTPTTAKSIIKINQEQGNSSRHTDKKRQPVIKEST